MLKAQWSLLIHDFLSSLGGPTSYVMNIVNNLQLPTMALLTPGYIS